MERQPVVSTNLAFIGYDDETETLEIEFRNGAVYRYFAVPAGEHEGLLAAPSKGIYFNQRIKDRYANERA